MGTSLHFHHDQEIHGGYLCSRQEVRGTGPAISPEAWDRFADLIEANHIEAVRRSSLGLLSCRSGKAGLECRLLGRWPGLMLQETERVQRSDRICIRWKIGTGFLGRRNERSNGEFSLGLDCDDPRADPARWTLWAQVEGYPSRFLPLPSSRWGYWLRAFIGGRYAAYHRIVTFRYLRRLAQQLQRGAR